MKENIAEEQARKEIAEWAEFFEAELTEDSIKSLLPAVKRGRILLDEDSQKFMVTLRSPIKLENGEMLEMLEMREPTGGELQEANKKHNEMELLMWLFAELSGQPIGLIKRIGQRDILTLSAVYDFFG